MTSNRASHRHKRRLRVSVGSTPLFNADLSAGGFTSIPASVAQLLATSSLMRSA